MAVSSNTFWQARLDKIALIIVAYEDAILALGTAGGVQEYTLDTGQNRTTVKRSDLDMLNKVLSSLYNQYATLQARITGCGVSQVSPAW